MKEWNMDFSVLCERNISGFKKNRPRHTYSMAVKIEKSTKHTHRTLFMFTKCSSSAALRPVYETGICQKCTIMSACRNDSCSATLCIWKEYNGVNVCLLFACLEVGSCRIIVRICVSFYFFYLLNLSKLYKLVLQSDCFYVINLTLAEFLEQD